MNEPFTNKTDPEETDIARKLHAVAEQTEASQYFTSELEGKLREQHRPKTALFIAWRDLTPTLTWVALVLVVGFLLIWSIRTLVPAPQPASNGTPVNQEINETPTPTPEIRIENTTLAPEDEGVDFRGAKLFLQQPLPDSPDTAHVYEWNKEFQPATLEQARAFAERFGVQGEVYLEPNFILGTTNYSFSDGKQILSVYSERSFTYIADLATTSFLATNTPNDNAEAIIREFLQVRGFDFPFRVVLSDDFDGYIVQTLAPDSIPLQYESFTTPSMMVMLDENGAVLRVDASLMNYDTNPVGEYSIISAQEAFEKLRNDNTLVGKMEWSHAADQPMQDWYRSYPDNKLVTVYGHISVFPAANAGTPALVLVDGVPVSGNTTGMESLERYTFVKVTGQYIVENGIRRLQVESWDRKVTEMSFTGSLSQQDDQIILTSINGSGEQYALIDPPTDLPLDRQSNNSTLDISGAMVDGKIFWTFIRFFEDFSGSGGGGGSGFGFYKLNLSGPPVPFPTPTPNPFTSQGALINQPIGSYIVQEGDTLSMIAQNYGITVDELIRINSLTDTTIYIGQSLYVPITETTVQRMENLRGYLSVSIPKKSDGTSAKEYTLEVAQNSGWAIYGLDGSILGELDEYSGLPILVTGTFNSTGKLFIESYEIPYPGLHFQILRGTQRTEQLGGQTVTVFTTEDGISYVEYLVTNEMPNSSIIGSEGDLIQQEVLIIPDETFADMPVAHIYQSAFVQEDGPEMQITGSLIHEVPAPEPNLPGEYHQPDLTITLVELTYFMSNPYYQINDPNYDQRSPYIQPVWHFHGRYADGTEFDVLIQALNQEFLLPEVVPNVSMG